MYTCQLGDSESHSSETFIEAPVNRHDQVLVPFQTLHPSLTKKAKAPAMFHGYRPHLETHQEVLHLMKNDIT